MILAIIIMFIYLGIVVNVGWQIKIQGPQMTTTPSRMNIFAILAILGISFTTETCQHYFYLFCIRLNHNFCNV